MTVRDLLPLYAVGAVDDDEARAVEEAIAANAELAAELDRLLEAASDLTGALPGVSPSPALRARLLDSVAALPAPGRFERFVDRFAALFDCGVARARELLGLVDDPAAWEPGPGPGSWLIHFAPSPSLAGADTGFVRLAPGERFQWHSHTGDEHALVLSGRAHDTLTGRDLGPGDEQLAPAGTAHEFHTLGTEPFVFAVWVWGVDFASKKP